MYRKVFMMMVPLGRSCFFLKKKQGKVHLKIGSELFCSMLIKVVQFQLKATLLGVFCVKHLLMFTTADLLAIIYQYQSHCKVI